MIKYYAPILGLALLFSACGEQHDRANEGPSAVDVFVAGIADEQILDDLKRFSSDTKTLRQRAEDFCEDPGDQTLATLREQWTKAAGAWYRVQLFNFGPADADPVFPLFTFIDSLRLRGTDYTDSVMSTLEAWRTSDDELDAEFFAEQRFNDVGLLALELALYGSEEPLSAFLETPRRCDILIGLATSLERRATQLREGWTEDYNGTGTPFVELLLEDELPNGRQPLAQLVLSGQDYLHYLHDRGVVKLAGRASDSSWLLVGNALDAIEDLLAVDHGGGSLFEWMERLGHASAVEKVSGDLAAARDALKARAVEDFEAALALLDGDFKREVPDALGIELGLTLTDGD